MVFGFTVEQAHEYLAALILLALGAVSLVAVLVQWKGIQQWPKFTMLAKISGVVVAIAFLVVSLIWVYGEKGDQHWSRLPEYWEKFRGNNSGKGSIAGSTAKPEVPSPQPTGLTTEQTSFVNALVDKYKKSLVIVRSARLDGSGEVNDTGFFIGNHGTLVTTQENLYRPGETLSSRKITILLSDGSKQFTPQLISPTRNRPSPSRYIHVHPRPN
jgi:hypothetical protein